MPRGSWSLAFGTRRWPNKQAPPGLPRRPDRPGAPCLLAQIICSLPVLSTIAKKRFVEAVGLSTVGHVFHGGNQTANAPRRAFRLFHRWYQKRRFDGDGCRVANPAVIIPLPHNPSNAGVPGACSRRWKRWSPDHPHAALWLLGLRVTRPLVERKPKDTFQAS